jgi:hypothetical protein
MSIFEKLKNLANRRDNNSSSERLETPKDNIDSRNTFCPTCGVLLKEKTKKGEMPRLP